MTSDREIRDWATRVVDLYASRVSMTLLEQGMLERAMAAGFRDAAEIGLPVTEWADAANGAIDEWERHHPQRGTRISGFSASGKQVIEKRRAL